MPKTSVFICDHCGSSLTHEELTEDHYQFNGPVSRLYRLPPTDSTPIGVVISIGVSMGDKFFCSKNCFIKWVGDLPGGSHA